jgi:FkbM family methyltransferase
MLVVSELFGVPVSVELPLTYAGISFSFTCTQKSDIAVLKEVFLLEEYAQVLPWTPKTILDLGAHVGDTALYFHAKYPEAVIFAVEPHPVLYTRLVKNVEHIKNIIAIHAAVGEKDGTTMLYTSHTSSLRGSVYMRPEADEEVAVPMLSAHTLSERYTHGPTDLCKFDIEGGESAFFRGQNPKAVARAYVGEYHEDLTGIPVERFAEYFQGYQIVVQPLGKKRRFKFEAVINAS